MSYEDNRPSKPEMKYLLACFLLKNLAARDTIEWIEAFEAHSATINYLEVAELELLQLATRADPQDYIYCGIRKSRIIVGDNYGNMFGHKTSHSNTANRVDV